jgi:HPt (histidine-containing phosphotransfer) domain-containing protein
MATEFDSRLNAMRARFAERCTGHVDELDVLLARVGTAPDESRETLRGLGHRLAGTAGTFGFTQVAEFAAQLERLCEDGTDPEAIAASCAGLRAALQAASAGAP